MRKILLGALFCLVTFALLIWYAALPAVKAPAFPSEKVFVIFEPMPGDLAPPETLRVVTYNIGFASGKKNNEGAVLIPEEVEANLEMMAKTLQGLHPDIIALQEVDFSAARTFNINQLDYLSKALHLPYGAYVVTWNKNYIAWPYWPPRRHFGHVVSGQAVLSRFPILNQETFRFEKPKKNPFWYNWFYLDRVGQRLSLKIGNKETIFWNVHLEAFDNTTRVRQAQKLGEWVNQNSGKTQIVAGDFNSVSYSLPLSPEEIKKFGEDRAEALNQFIQITHLKNAEPNQPLYSMPSWKPVKKIDHIFYSEDLHLKTSGNIPNLIASDHLPIWAVFSFSGQ